MQKVNSILYVEDEKNVQEELAEVLEFYCENLYLADDGKQGLKQFIQYKPDIIITDIKMPIMDGIEMSKKIKEINKEQHIIFTTAFSDIDFFQEAIELQVDGYIIKPIDLTLLENKIESVIKNIKLKEELFEKEQMLLQTSKLASMGEMIGNIAHQWKQPLSIISTCASSLIIEHDLDQINKESVLARSENIMTQTEYLNNTINDFTDFFKPNDHNNNYNVKRFLDKCIDLVHSSFEANTIETMKEVDDKINSYGDPSQLTQAIINILNNAKDALKASEKLQKKLVFIVTAKEDNHNNIELIIKDNAGGIPENIIENVFDPYFTTKSKDEGTGLGLYITKTIITKKLKGNIKVENEVFDFEGITYKGAKFTITLPLANHD